MTTYLHLIKYQNLILITGTQFAIKYGLFEPFQIDTMLDDFHYVLLILATICIAAGGHVIHHIFDPKSDYIAFQEKNVKTRISEKNAYTLFFVLNVIGVALGFYLANHIEKPGFSSFFVIISALLYVHASYLKQLPFIGNMTIAVLLALTIIIPGIFDLLPVITPQNKVNQSTIFSILLDYALLAFLLSMLSEIVTDCKNIDKHHNTGIKTIPMILGRDRTIKLVGIFALIPMTAIFLYCYTYLFSNSKAVSYALLLLIAPLLYFAIKCWSAETKKHFANLSIVLKAVMITAALSISIYSVILK